MADEHRSVTIPRSDCGCFVVGEVGPESFVPPMDAGEYPKCGVIIWYEDRDLAKQAAKALFDDEERQEA